MYYIGTTVLGMTEKEFWECTPRKLFALLDRHNKANSFDETVDTNAGKQVTKMTLQDLMSMR